MVYAAAMKATTITGSLTAVGILLIYALGETIAKSDGTIKLIGLVLLSACISIGLSWGWTQAYKRRNFGFAVNKAIAKPFAGKTEDPYYRQRNKVYFQALYSGIISNLCFLCFLFLVEADPLHKLALAVVWILWSVLIGFLSPFLWRVVFVRILKFE